MWLLCDGHDHERALARGGAHLLEPLDVDVDAVEDLAEHPRHDRARHAEHPRLGIGGDLAQRDARALLELLRRQLLGDLDLLGLGDEAAAAQHLLADALHGLARRTEHDAHLRLRAGRRAASAGGAPARRRWRPPLRPRNFGSSSGSPTSTCDSL